MINKLHFYCKVAGLLLRGNLIQPETIRQDYDRLSCGYDDYFSRYVGKHSREMIKRLGLLPGAKVVDLACGTGTLSLVAAEYAGEHGRVTGVDSSCGMLVVAENKRIKCGYENVRFIEGDIKEVLTRFDDASLDAVTCGWAIGYVNPRELISLAGRKIKPGGRIGIIENVRDTLAPIRKTALKVAQAMPQNFDRLMDLHFKLPRGSGDLCDHFHAAGLKVLQDWEGEENFIFNGGAEVLDWVLHTGASAGFDRVMKQEARKRCDSLFVEFIERDFKRDGCIKVAHHYAAGIARRES